MASVKVLLVSQVEENPQALRTTVDKDTVAYQELKDSIKQYGLLNSISVREYAKEDGTVGYRLVDGLHRLTALQDLGFTEVPTNIVTVEDSRLLATQIVGNSVSVKTTKSQYAQGLKQLIQHQGWTVKEVARTVNKSESWVRDQLGLTELPESILALVNDDKICVANAGALKLLPKDQIENFLQAAMTESPDTFCPKVGEAAKELKAAAREGRKPDLGFKPTAHVRKPAELKKTIEEFKVTGTVSEFRSLLEVANVSDPFEAMLLTLNWVLSLDPVSVSAQKAKWDGEQASKEATKAAKAAEKAAKAKADAAAEVANHVAA